jgi:hypothetical protein
MYAMGGKTFDLTETILDLLRRIDEGRKTVRETQKFKDRCMNTFADRDKAGQLVNELQSKMASLDEPAKSQANAELDRQMSEFQKLNDESSRQWLQFNETIAFIGPFSRDVLLLLERLPLKPEWDAYRQAVGCLNVIDREFWTDPPTNSPLETLEMRLREMLDLAGGTQVGRGLIEHAPSRSEEHQAGRTSLRHRRGNPDTDRIRNQVRGLYNEAIRQNERPTSATICQQLDSRNILLPHSTVWGRKCRTWPEAFKKYKGALTTWLSRAKPYTK